MAEDIYKHVHEKVDNLRKEVGKKIDDIYEYTEGIHNRFEEWADIQDNKFDRFQEHINNKLDKLVETVNRKSELDSALIAQFQNKSKRVDKMEIAKESYDKSIAELSVKVDQLLQLMTKHSLDKMSRDITVAHERIRDHENRIRPLEKRAGKTAIKVLWHIAASVAGLITGLIIAYAKNLFSK